MQERTVPPLEDGNERDDAENLLEKILNRDNLNRAYKRVKSNKGAAGIDGMTVEEALLAAGTQGRTFASGR